MPPWSGWTTRRSGQEVKAFVVARDPGRLSGEDVQAWCRATLAGFKVPTQVEFLSELPFNASGKVMKQALGRPGTETGFVQD